MASSLLNLEEDLTCSICLCPFNNPVSLACGHSFCQQCLEAAWESMVTVSCPHCRKLYAVKPELKRNTVLSAVLDTIKFASNLIEELDPKPKPAPQLQTEPAPVLCDTCMQNKAESTCMTCAASFCIEHLRPHRENPVYRAHRLVEPPLADLHRRLCADHAKLLEFYCTQHECSICSGCLQEHHRGCTFFTQQEQRDKKESELKQKLGTLDGKIEKNQLVFSQMKDQQAQLKEAAAARKRAVQLEYQQLRDALQRDEKEALNAVDIDLESGLSKLGLLMKKFTHNIEKMSGTRDKISSLLTQSESLDFLQVSVELPSEVGFDPYAPRITLDSKQIIAYHACIVNLKEMVVRILKQPVENRLSLIRPGAAEVSHMMPAPMREPGFNPTEIPQPIYSPQAKGAAGGAKKKSHPRERKDNRGEWNENKDQRDPRGDKNKKFPNRGMNSQFSKSMDGLSKVTDTLSLAPVDMSSAIKRSDLLRFGSVLTFDQRTAHKRVILSENNTKATVSDEPCGYPDIPLRFTVCSQVLCSKGFSQGRHYWEVKMSSNNFCGIGLAYGSIDRKGPSSRLGRNAQSWCVEWFNVKLSAWHNSSETVLVNPNPSRVGILLDCDGGSATFYNITDRAYPFHTFVFPFSGPVYPAFWIFSGGSSISLCKLSN